MPGEIFAVNDLAQLLLHHWRIHIIIVNPLLVPGVVWRINVNAFDLSGIKREKGFQRLKVVTVDDQIVMKAHFFRQAFALDRDKLMILHQKMVILNEHLAFELDLSHGFLLRQIARTVWL
jgi:hypothetical protein